MVMQGMCNKMKRDLPEQLKNPDYRFFLAGKDKKHPYERGWNTDKSYMFFEPKLQQHLRTGGNIGICTGYAGLIVIDFDDVKFQDEKDGLLPKTFTTRTAGKGLKHFYYTLIGSDMISKTGLDKHVLNGRDMSLTEFQELRDRTSFNKMRDMEETGALDVSRIMDIQAGGCGITCPPSQIGDKFYSVIDDTEVQEIHIDKLTEVFNLGEFKMAKKRGKISSEVQPEKIQASIDILKELGIDRTNTRHYKCPFHRMHGGGNLWVGNDGSIHCFHCGAHASSGETFKSLVNAFKVVI